MKGESNERLKQAFALQQAGELAKAKTLFEEILTLEPNQADALHGMGLLYVQQRAFESALPWFVKAVENAPTIPAFHNNLANCYKALNQPDIAIRHYRQALKLKSPYPEARNNLGQLYYKQGLFVEAREQLQKAVREDPEHVDAHYNLGNCYVQQDRLMDAVSHYRAVLKLRPDHLGATHNLGILLTAIKDFEAAGPLLEKSLERQPNDLDALFHLAIIQASTGNLERAVELYLKTIELDPQHGDACHNLATLYLHLKQEDKALTFYKQALAINPHNKTAAHMIKALEGKTSEQGAPPEYIRALFDQYAYNYNQHVTQSLQYDVPAQLRQAVTPLAMQASLWRVLDLGCGTGLCAPYFRDIAAELVGVDISPNMIDVANQQKGYDRLLVQDIYEYLQESKKSFNLIVAADVLVYLGDLNKLFELVYDNLETDGVFCFSIELSTQDQPFSLQPTGRYAHQSQYIESLAKNLGFEIYQSTKAILRMQEESEIYGLLVVLTKSDGSA